MRGTATPPALLTASFSLSDALSKVLCTVHPIPSPDNGSSAFPVDVLRENGSLDIIRDTRDPSSEDKHGDVDPTDVGGEISVMVELARKEAPGSGGACVLAGAAVWRATESGGGGEEEDWVRA